MDLLSKWRVKPYIDLYLWEMYYKCEFPLVSDEWYRVLRVENKVVYLEGAYDTHYHISEQDFNELMCEVIK